MSTSVAEEIRRQISAGFLSGELREEEVAASLNVSRTPVREAISQLVAEGLIVKERSRPARVFRPSLEELSEIYEIRAPLEALAARRAAENADDAFVEDLRRLLDDLSNAAPGAAFSAGHEAFHMRLTEGSNRRRLEILIRNLRAQSEPYIRIALQVDPEFKRSAQDQHRLILEAMEQRQGARAEQLVAKHLADTMLRVPEILSLKPHPMPLQSAIARPSIRPNGKRKKGPKR